MIYLYKKSFSKILKYKKRTQSYCNGRCKDNCSSGYFPKSAKINQDSYFICIKCYDNCQTCIDEGNSNNMKCDTCKINHIKYNDNCFKIYNSSLKNFYYPKNNDFLISSCYQEFGLYIKEDSNECIHLADKDEGYYISNNETGLLSKCHDNCLSCNNGPTKNYAEHIESMECLKCKDSNNNKMIKINHNCFKIVQYNESTITFNISEIDPNNPLGSCMDFGKAIYYGEYKCINKPQNTYYILNDNNETTGVIKDCNKACNTCFGGWDDTNSNCIDCAEGYIKDEKLDTNCIKNKNLSSNDEECTSELFDKEKTISEIRELIRSDISSYISSCKVFNGSNFLASVVSSDNIDPEKQIKKGISSFDLGNCTNVIKEYYNISIEEKLLVLNMETKNDENKKNESNNNDDKSFNIGKYSQLEIYDYSGNKLDLSICKDNIKIIKYIDDVEEIDLHSAKILSNKGIDIFNANDKFFNDICHPYENPDGKDIILNDRRNDIYQNVSFCQEGCTYNGINYT